MRYGLARNAARKCLKEFMITFYLRSMKTIHETAKEYARALFKNEQLVTYSAFTAGVKFAQRWIPVEEELPVEECGFYRPVLVFVEEYGLCSSAAYKNGEFIPDNPVIDPDEITHWRLIELR